MGKGAERGRKMVETAMIQTCSACPARPRCRVNPNCFLRFLRNVKRITDTAKKYDK